MKYILLAILVILLSACSSDENDKGSEETTKSANAVTPEGKAVFAMCAQCHGTDGHNRALGRSKSIAGWESERVKQAIKGYIAGTYGGPMSGLMKSQIESLSDDDIEAVSQYISTLK